MRKFLAALAFLAGFLPAIAAAQAPPPVPALPDTERRTTYSLTAQTGPFSVGFALYGDGTDYGNWIQVFLISGTAPNQTVTQLQPVTGFTLSSATGPIATIPRPITDATITLVMAQTGTLQIVGARRPRRTTQFTENRGVAARDLNQGLTDIIAENRERWDQFSRAIVAPPGEALAALPPAGTRAGGFLCWDATGLIPQACGSAAGLGNVTGPNTSVVGHVAVFNNTSGTLLADGGAVGTGNVVGPGSSTVGHVATFNNTTGTLLQDPGFSITNTSGTLTVASGKTLTVNNSLTLTGTDGTSFAYPTASDTLVGLAATQTLINKTLTSPTITGGTHTALTALGIRSTGAAFDLTLASNEVLTAGRTLTMTVGNANRNLNLSGDFINAGGNSLTLTTSGATNVTLPTSGTLVASPITSVGTVTTGTWSATPIGVAFGGTGQATAILARGANGLNVDSLRNIGDTAATLTQNNRVAATNAALTASRIWTLPAANTVNAGQSLYVLDLAGGVTSTNTIVITRAGSDTVNNSTSATLNTAFGGFLLVSDGVSKWSAQALGSQGSAGVTTLGGLAGAVGVTNGIEVSGNNIQVTSAFRTSPTQQVFTTGTNLTYTTPANVLRIRITLVGGGGGGSGGASGGSGGVGTATCWNTSGTACTSPVFQAGGGAGGTVGSSGGVGGTTSGSTACTIYKITGNPGGPATASGVGLNTSSGAPGGASFLGGAGANVFNNTGQAAAANSGSGGQGGGATSTSNVGGSGGGAGATCVTTINAPAATYVYTVGTGGSAGTAGTDTAGGAGAAGYIVVEEFYGI